MIFIEIFHNIIFIEIFQNFFSEFPLFMSSFRLGNLIIFIIIKYIYNAMPLNTMKYAACLIVCKNHIISQKD